MPYVKNTSYRNLPFSSETPKDEFYTFSTVPELAAKSEMFREDTFFCRTVGILHSTDGKFFLTDVHSPNIKEDEPMIRITMVFLKSPLQSVGAPHPVQIFGTLQWKNRPVIFAKIVQMLSSAMALRVRDTYNVVTSTHLAKSEELVNESDLEISISQLNDTFVVD